MDNLNKVELAVYEEEWYGGNENLIRTGINQQRNYCCDEARSTYVKLIKEGKEQEWPTKDNILRLALRKDIQDEDFPLLVKYSDYLLIKTAGISYWKPSKRHYETISNSVEPANSRLNPGFLRVDYREGL